MRRITLIEGDGIGPEVTRAVVTSLILILVLDYFVTKALI